MEKKKSYQELLKEYTMTQLRNETDQLEKQMDLFLNGLLQKTYEAQLRTEIDHALDRKDEEAFHKLAGELLELVGESQQLSLV